jgi:hypothetical protein
MTLPPGSIPVAGAACAQGVRPNDSSSIAYITSSAGRADMPTETDRGQAKVSPLSGFHWLSRW